MTAGAATGAARAVQAGTLDFDLHGLAAIRLIGATAADASAVERQLGPLQAPLSRDPDIVIRFVDAIKRGSRVRYIGLDDAGFADDAFLVLRSKHKSPARVRIDFDQLGGPIEILCERGVTAVPLLIPILNLTLLTKGVLPLHGSAFVHEGVGIVATGWSKGGKTEALLAFAARGAEYIGDEWVYVPGEGDSVYGIPQPIRVWEWQLRQLPEYDRLIGSRARARLRVLEALVGQEHLWRRAAGGRLAALLKRQLYVDVEPARLFGGLGGMSTTFDRLFFLVAHDDKEVTVEPVEVSEVAGRMAFSLRYENLDLTAAYLKYRFAYPEARGELVDHAASLQREALLRALRGKPAFLVQHPYPVSLRALFDVMAPYCG